MNKTLIIFEMNPEASTAHPVEVTDAELKELKDINGLMVNCGEMSEEQEAASLKWQERLSDLPMLKGSFPYGDKGVDSQIDLPWVIEHVIFTGFAL